MKNKLQEAISIIKQGGIAIFPTDTAFGIGCRIDDEGAVKRLFVIKQRSETQATPVLVSSIDMAKEYCTEISLEAEKLMGEYWPGALTIVVQSRTDNVPALIRGGYQTIGLRMPNHQVPLELIQEMGVPIIGTSANFHGKKTPFRFEDLDPKLVQLVDIVISGECTVKQPSTVIDCTVTPGKVLREGAVKI